MFSLSVFADKWRTGIRKLRWYLRVVSASNRRPQEKRVQALEAIWNSPKAPCVARCVVAHNLARHYRNAGELWTAYAILTEARRLETDPPPTLNSHLLCFVLYDLGEYERCWGLLAQERRTRALAGYTNALAVEVAFLTERREEGQQVLEQMLAKCRRRGVEQALEAAAGLDSKGKHEAGRRIYQAILDCQPKHVEALKGLVRTCVHTGASESALMYARRLERFHDDEDVRAFLAYLEK